jgi:hypothetical protein
MQQSKIFTPTEQKEFERRLNGEKKDYKIWYRVKPKLIELLELFKIKKKIEKTLQPSTPRRTNRKGTGG